MKRARQTPSDAIIVLLVMGAVVTTLWFPPAVAQTVRPSGYAVPENLLRISLSFDREPGGPILPRLALRRDDGSMIIAPFLDQELWTPDGRILTVLMHPGRVKTGLIAHDELGGVLESGVAVTLMFDGKPLKRWRVQPPVESPIRTDDWQIAAPPRAGSRSPLVVQLKEPIDALAVDLIAVRAPDGTRVKGTSTLLRGETVWRLIPKTRWSRGTYTIITAPDLEDPAGNRQDLSFEHPGHAVACSLGYPTFAVN